jgi:hypothetical protein
MSHVRLPASEQEDNTGRVKGGDYLIVNLVCQHEDPPRLTGGSSWLSLRHQTEHLKAVLAEVDVTPVVHVLAFARILAFMLVAHDDNHAC